MARQVPARRRFRVRRKAVFPSCTAGQGRSLLLPGRREARAEQPSFFSGCRESQRECSPTGFPTSGNSAATSRSAFRTPGKGVATRQTGFRTSGKPRSALVEQVTHIGNPNLNVACACPDVAKGATILPLLLRALASGMPARRLDWLEISAASATSARVDAGSPVPTRTRDTRALRIGAAQGKVRLGAPHELRPLPCFRVRRNSYARFSLDAFQHNPVTNAARAFIPTSGHDRGATITCIASVRRFDSFLGQRTTD